MAPSMATVLRAPTKLCSFLCVLLISLLFFVLDVYTLLAYDRHTHLETGLWVPECRRFVYKHSSGALCLGHTTATTETQPKKREESWCPRQTETPCLSTSAPYHSPYHSNVQSLDNKLCELRARISHQWETRDCCIICLPETWLSVKITDSAIELSRFSVHRVDRMKEFTGKSRGGGVCFFINNSLWIKASAKWFNVNVNVRSFCSPDLEYLTLLCRPFWLPREFTAVIITAAPACLRAEIYTGSTHPQDISKLVGPIRFYTARLFWTRWLGDVLGCFWWQHRGLPCT